MNDTYCATSLMYLKSIISEFFGKFNYFYFWLFFMSAMHKVSCTSCTYTSVNKNAANDIVLAKRNESFIITLVVEDKRCLLTSFDN